MDIRYKSFVTRSKQDHSFENLLKTSSVTKPSYNFPYNKSSTTVDFSNISQKSPPQLSNNRKKVNVVTFKPDDSNELLSNKQVNLSGSEHNSSECIIDSNIILPKIRSSRIKNKLENIVEGNDNGIDSISELLAGKRKAAKDVSDAKSKSKKKCNSVNSEDFSTKRAVSPEILKPEPRNNTTHLKKCKDLSLQSNKLDCDEITENKNCKLQPQATVLDTKSKSVNKPSNIATSISDHDRIRQFNNESLRNIQKSRPIINSKKNKIKYNHRPWQSNIDEEECDDQLKTENVVKRSNSDSVIKPQQEAQLYDFDYNDELDCKTSKIIRQKHFTKVHSDLSEQQTTDRMKTINYGKYPVLENMREAHECQEKGETQDLLDDVDYLIEGIKDNLSASTRTLSIITLTGKCMVKSFRELLKAHGLLTKIFRYLDDAYLDESVAMSTAALFLVFSRDKQPRIFDDTSLSLLLKLPRISKTERKQSKENERIRDKIRLMLSKYHQTPANDHKSSDLDLHTKQNEVESFHRHCACCHHLKLDNNITTEDLVVECLLQFSSRKCPDWFKSLLRKHHGLDLICDQVISSVEYLGVDLGPQCLDEFVMDRLYRLFNYMRFFEHMTFQNRDNQSYLVDYSDTSLIDTLLRCLKLCASNLSYQCNGSVEKKVIQACLLASLRLLANISHDNEYTCNLMGSSGALLKLIFSCLLHLPRFMSTSKRFDLSVLALALLINLVEHCSENRRRMAHVSISRKRVACLGRCGQIVDLNIVQPVNNIASNDNNTSKSMEFSFDDEAEDEDMDIDDDADNDNEDPNQYTNVNCESSDTKINVLEALVKLFLRHDDRAKNNTLIEGEEGEPVEDENDNSVSKNGDVNDDPKWRLVADKTQLRKLKANKTRGHNGRDMIMDMSDSEDDGSSEEGADVEFMINSKEEEAELQKKLSAAGQHMQDSVVSAYAALLLGCIIKSSHHYMERIRQHLPMGKFKVLAFVLAKFLSILSLTSDMSRKGEESILEIVRLLEAQDNNNHRHNSEITEECKRTTLSLRDDSDEDDEKDDDRSSVSEGSQ